MSSTFFIPAVNIMGIDCLDEAMVAIRNYGFRKALIVTDAGLAKAGVAGMIAEKLAMQDIDSVIFDGAKPNPSIDNVEKGLAQLQQSGCDFVISLGGGSPHDCAKGIALCATNGGHISDYEGVDRSTKPQLPLIAINTTAGTASEMTRFCIITDEKRHVKMAIVDRNVTPLLSVNDPALMVAMPKGLTAATGMDALTHAIEAYVSTAANPITDACALKAVTMISQNLRQAVRGGSDLTARENMAYAQFLAGMAFNNASLGFVHAMAHQLGGFYDLPHGVCNAAAPCAELQRDGLRRTPDRRGPRHGRGHPWLQPGGGRAGGHQRHSQPGPGRRDSQRLARPGRQADGHPDPGRQRPERRLRLHQSTHRRPAPDRGNLPQRVLTHPHSL